MKKNTSKTRTNRRRFLKNTALTGAVVSLGFPSVTGKNNGTPNSPIIKNPVSSKGELLYNGIQLPKEWPPNTMKPNTFDPMPLPYLSNPPDIIPIDVGRQLFIDDFLIEYTNLKRTFHQPMKYEGNPLLRPETEVEMNQGYCPMAAPFSDGCFYDPSDNLFKMWYMAGWFEGTALATSTDGIRWQRPKLDVVPGTNLVLPPGESRDGVSVWIDHEAPDQAERFKMYRFERKGKVGEELSGGAGYILTSPTGIHWKWHGQIGKTGDNSTFFYNPFRKKWCFTIRAFGRAVPPWQPNTWNGSKKGRARSYWENEDFKAAIGDWKGFDPVFWLGADRLDHRPAGYEIGREPQLYKVDAVGYESLMIGLLQPHYGPPNTICAEGGYPKLTELQLAFSRDGFHWDRTNRETFIGATLKKDSWERAYIHSVGGVCNIVGDKLYFYYTAFQGDESKRHDLQYWSGMYANASTGMAILRRDGFASIEATTQDGTLLTKKLKFTGNHLFVNLDSTKGALTAEICNENGTPITGFQQKDCVPITGDSTRQMLIWDGGNNLGSLKDQPIRLKFYLQNANLYAFWISQNQDGASGGATAAGGPGLNGNWDN